MPVEKQQIAAVAVRPQKSHAGDQAVPLKPAAARRLGDIGFVSIAVKRHLRGVFRLRQQYRPRFVIGGVRQEPPGVLIIRAGGSLRSLLMVTQIIEDAVDAAVHLLPSEVHIPEHPGAHIRRTDCRIARYVLVLIPLAAQKLVAPRRSERIRIAAAHHAPVVVGVQVHRQPHLFDVARTARRSRLLPRLIQRRQQHARQNRDDRDYHEQLNQRKFYGSRP